MKTEGIVRNVKVLARAEGIVADIKLKTLLVKSALSLVALLVGLFGLGMLAFAAYVALERIYGPLWAATILGVGSIVVAALLLAIASRVRPGRDLELARQLHDQAMEALMTDVRDVEAEVRGMTRLMRNPLDGALPGLVLPLAKFLLRSLRSGSDKKKP